MKINQLKITNFRNYEQAKVDFCDGLNVVIGGNAQGKTNLLEAVLFCSIGKSVRVSKEKEVIKFNKDISKISLSVEKKFGKCSIDILFSKKEKKTVKINQIPIRRIGELLGELTCVYFSPDELKLIKESPEDRRRFMDIDISQTSKQYFFLLTRYEKILANRNKLLKSTTDRDVVQNTIPIWDEQLAETGSKIIHFRLEFLKNLSPYASLAHSFLSNEKEKLELDYVGQFKETPEQTKEELLKSLNKNFEKDFKLGFTSVGPHRDDIKVIVNDIDIRTYGSQGQQRTTALAMKLAELEIIKNQTGEYPILLLDDVFSELDFERRKKLIKFCSKTQSIVTCTDFEFENLPHKKIVVSQGTICD